MSVTPRDLTQVLLLTAHYASGRNMQETISDFQAWTCVKGLVSLFAANRWFRVPQIKTEVTSWGLEDTLMRHLFSEEAVKSWHNSKWICPSKEMISIQYIICSVCNLELWHVEG